MKEAFNFHALLQNPTANAFITRLDLDTKTSDVLDDAIVKVKATLGPALQKIATAAGIAPKFAMPRFRLQGSTVYKTQNSPAHTPQQQVDADLGVYLSAAFLDTASNGNSGIRHPARALAKQYFDTVDGLLKKLCEKEGWKYAEGKKKKDTCCRIDLSPKGVHAHIDVPLYAAPNDEFAKSVSFADAALKSLIEARTDISPQIDQEGWDELTVVVMATRSGEWAESDVQIVIQHFRNASARFEHPFVLRKIWRYVKAWRDFIWRDGGAPSSVLLMEAVVRIFDANLSLSKELLGSGREDRILHYVFANLPAQLGNDVIVKWGSTAENLNIGDATMRREWSGMAKACHKTLDQAMFDETLYPQQVINLVKEGFGQRIPSDVNLIKFLAITPAAAFANTPPKIQPSPQERIHRTTGA